MRKIKEYLNNVKLKGKFVGFVLMITFLSIVAILLTSIYGGKKALEKQILAGITNTADLKVASISNFYDNTVANLEFLTQSNAIQHYNFNDNENEYQHQNTLKTLKNYIKYHNYFKVHIVDKNFNYLLSTDIDLQNKPLPNILLNTIKKQPFEISNSPIYKENDLFLISFIHPIKNKNEDIKGYLVVDIDMEPVYEMIQNSSGLGKTGETLIGIETQEGALFLNPLRHDKNAALNRKAIFGNESAKPLLEASKGKTGSGFLTDYRGEEVIAVWRYIPSFNWGLVAKIDESEAFEPVYDLRNQLIVIAIFTTFIGILIALRFAFIITNPINKLKDAMIVIGQGNVLSKKLKKNSNDEVGEMIDQANNLVDFQKNIIEFTEEIGKGNFNFESSHDISKGDLGKELLKMKASLQNVSEDEKRRNWATEGLAQFAGILRNNNDDLSLLADDIITNLVKYLGANQGGIFIISDDRKKPKMQLASAYAYERKKFLEKEFSIGEGLIGQCWQEKEKIFLTDIPDSYINITSGLGTANPTCILIIPLIINEEIYGIIELASFDVFQKYQIDFVERLASSIASTLSSVKINLHTSALLEESQQMSEELQAQEEELRQNAEEMQATQEEMERAQKELIKKEAGLRAIIDNSEDTIFAINKEYEITVVNAKLKNKYKGVGIDLSPGRSILEVLPADKRDFWKARYDRAMQGEKYETVDEVAPGIKASVYHYPTFNENNEITGVAVVSRVLHTENNNG